MKYPRAEKINDGDGGTSNADLNEGDSNMSEEEARSYRISGADVVPVSP